MVLRSTPDTCFVDFRAKATVSVEQDYSEFFLAAFIQGMAKGARTRLPERASESAKAARAPPTANYGDCCRRSWV
jgi:hypothetical protein